MELLEVVGGSVHFLQQSFEIGSKIFTHTRKSKLKEAAILTWAVNLIDSIKKRCN